jgi:zinc transporter, ZIP family
LLRPHAVPDHLIWTVFWVALATDLATGLGALPLIWRRSLEPRWHGLGTAATAGMMLSASLFALTGEALQKGRLWQVIAGLLIGALFFSGTARLLEQAQWKFRELTADESRRGMVVLVAMFVHSFPEGVAIGVGYATGELQYGMLLALAIAIHNIPEGLAVALPLRARGISIWKCFWYAILTSAPQPLAAVPSYMLVSVFKPLLPIGLGFAGGAMIYLVAAELLPESFERCSRNEVAWSFTLGLIGMLWFTGAIGL